MHSCPYQTWKAVPKLKKKIFTSSLQYLQCWIRQGTRLRIAYCSCIEAETGRWRGTFLTHFQGRKWSSPSFPIPPPLDSLIGHRAHTEISLLRWNQKLRWETSLSRLPQYLKTEQQTKRKHVLRTPFLTGYTYLGVPYCVFKWFVMLTAIRVVWAVLHQILVWKSCMANSSSANLSSNAPS